MHSIIAAAALSFVQPVQAAQSDPEVIIYRVSGVVDTGGTATSFHCTNFSGVAENIRVVVRSSNAALLANVSGTVGHLDTIIFSTGDVTIYSDVILATGTFGRGTAAIAATSINVTCSAMQVQSNITIPSGIALHMTRFNPIAGTQE